ncbi:MAG: RNA-binding protein [Prochloraceae cyanobacterium]|nr:RNA-binding protein [Prochloraceae cyanobacterium]
MTIYLENLSDSVTEEALRKLFSNYGNLKNLYLPHDLETGRIKGLAFVEMETEALEAQASTDLDGREWMGLTLKVAPASERATPSG